MYILEIIIIILLIRMIVNQHILDEHLDELRTVRKDASEYVCFDGIINRIIFIFTVLYNNIIYYTKSYIEKNKNNESK